MSKVDELIEKKLSEKLVIRNDKDLLAIRPEYLKLWKASDTRELTDKELKRSIEISNAIYQYRKKQDEERSKKK